MLQNTLQAVMQKLKIGKHCRGNRWHLRVQGLRRYLASKDFSIKTWLNALRNKNQKNKHLLGWSSGYCS